MALPSDVLTRPGAVLLDTARPDAENRRSLLFTEPVRVLRARRLAEVRPLLEAFDAAVEDGCHVAGYLCYEAGWAFEGRTSEGRTAEPGEGPLAWFGVYEAPAVLGQRDVRRLLAAHGGSDSHAVRDAHFDLDRAAYERKVATVKRHIRAGDVYQVNLTGPLRFAFDGSPVALYRALRQKQQVPYGVLLNTGDTHILSLSPELFFRRSGRRLRTCPMKGTVRRACTRAADEQMRRWLAADEKNRAENLMIVDLLRNDLSICCVPGSVRVPALFAVEPYETVHQMTSTVEGCLQEGTGYAEIFRALFPCGSVTGAPKRSAMHLIERLEHAPRGVYCGAVGYAAPGAEAAFNVAIRTIRLQDGAGTLGIGSGLVWDADAEAEYEECLLKGRFLTAKRSAQIDSGAEDFKLIETLRGAEGRIHFLDEHLARLRDSAAHFGFPFDENKVRARLTAAAGRLDPSQRYKVRLTLDRAGRVVTTEQTVEQAFKPSGTPPLRVTFARQCINPNDPFFYHKTTHRRVYEQAYRATRAAGCDEALLRNERGEVTEGTRANLFIRKGEFLYTPPVESGLLPGVYRQHVLGAHANAAERILTPSDVRAADALYLCSAVRGMREAVLVGDG